ncbi:hypothetical protein J1614_002830 [Plenodomus biglobosus]|nr:hypothetical protein J1614_002830 [Plenodomus biglobosus]
MAITHANQQNSPLLRLPAEIRNRIYSFVFCTEPILICFVTSYATRAVDKCPIPTSIRRRPSHIHYSRLNLALIETCRQAYFECRLLPFLLNTFEGFPEAILAAFPGRLYNLQLTSITRIELTIGMTDIAGGAFGPRGQRWSRNMNAALDSISRFPQLRNLRVTLDSGYSIDTFWKQFTEAVEEALRQRRLANGLTNW